MGEVGEVSAVREGELLGELARGALWGEPREGGPVDEEAPVGEATEIEGGPAAATAAAAVGDELGPNPVSPASSSLL